MDIGLAKLIDEGSVAHVEEARAFYAAKQATGGQRGPTNYEELGQARGSLPAGPAARGPLSAWPGPARTRSR